MPDDNLWRKHAGFFTSIPALQEIRDHGNDIDRWAFDQAMIVFSKDTEIPPLVAEIPRFPEQDRIRRIESYYSQMYYHFSFFEFAYYSQAVKPCWPF